jgi:hypothetical protein
MPPKVKVKRIMNIPDSAKQDIGMMSGMFKQLTGAVDSDIHMLLPKIKELKKLVGNYGKVLTIISNVKSTCIAVPEWAPILKELATEGKKLLSCVAQITVPTSISLNDETRSAINKQYKQIKNHPIINNMIVMASKLKPYAVNLTDSKDMSGKFINRIPGVCFQPLTYSVLDFKRFWNHENSSSQLKNSLMSLLFHTFSKGTAIFKITTSPNINIKEFAKKIVGSVGSLKKRIPGCDSAFGVISNSVKLMEDNFNGYYREAIAVKNPQLIIESFVKDVATTQTKTTGSVMQFHKIIKHLNQRKSGKKRDPKVDQMFDALHKQMSLMDVGAPAAATATNTSATATATATSTATNTTSTATSTNTSAQTQPLQVTPNSEAKTNSAIADPKN